MSAASFRDAYAGDATAVATLARRTFTDTFGYLYDAEDLEIFLARHSPKAWAAEIADPAYAVRLVEADASLIGYAKLGPPSLPFTPPAGAIELRQFYFLSAWQGQGLAPRLMEWAIGEARRRGMTALYLSVFIDNHRARRFYLKRGFVEVGPYAFMVGNHVDEDIVMKLAL